MPALPEQPSESGSEILLVATGPDHPGILDEISHYVSDRRAVIESIKVSNLGGWFTMLMRLSADETAGEQLRSDLWILQERAGVHASVEKPVEAVAEPVIRFSLVARGGPARDAAGESATLRQASNLLRVLNVNIIDVQADQPDDAPFELRMALDMPRSVPIGKFRELLGQLFDGLGAHWSLESHTP